MMAASMAISVASAAAGMAGDAQRYESEVDYTNHQQEANKRQMDENRDLATKAYLDQAEAANRSLAETREATAAQNFDKTREAVEVRGEVTASAAETGVGGNSVMALLNEFHRQEGMFKQRNAQNLLFKEQQTAQQVKGYKAEADARIASIRPMIAAPIRKVDYLGPMLGVASSGIGAYSQKLNLDMKAKGK